MSAQEHIAVTNFRKYLRINTAPPSPDLPGAVTFLTGIAEEIGLSHSVLEILPNRPILLMTLQGSDVSLSSILLISHMDVVPVYPDKWTYDPFSAHKDDKGDIYARGSQDMKSVGMQYLEALRHLKTRSGGAKFARTIHLSFMPDEEVGGPSMAAFVKHEEFKRLNVGFALDEEIAPPILSNLGVAFDDDLYRVFYADRNVWWLEVTCPGAAGHGSRFIENTAAEKLRQVINRFLEFREEQRQRLIVNPDLTIGDVISTNLTMLDGGVQQNVVPDRFTLKFDIRVPPTVDMDAFEATLLGWLRDISPEISHRFIQCKVKHMTSTDPNYPWWKAVTQTLDKLGLKYKKEIFSGATDSRYLREIGIPTVLFSPMINTPQLLHDHNEFLNEKIYLDGLDIYCHLLDAVANVPNF